jgi:acyl-CoA synthetase (AMP-forming)/AMP-acid ligase II
MASAARARQELSAAHAELLGGAVAKFQRVTDVMIMDDFPRNIEGKTLKRVLGEQYKRA